MAKLETKKKYAKVDKVSIPLVRAKMKEAEFVKWAKIHFEWSDAEIKKAYDNLKAKAKK